jgi:hypothetical protein
MALINEGGKLLLQNGVLASGAACCCAPPQCECSRSTIASILASVSGTYTLDSSFPCAGSYAIPEVSATTLFTFPFAFKTGSPVTFELAGGATAEAQPYLFCEAGSDPKLFRVDLVVTHPGCQGGGFSGLGSILFPPSIVTGGTCRPISFSGMYEESGMRMELSWTFTQV